ncbi:protein phosphatase 2C 70 isoform X3 [Manihot esculenta]|uniref:protein phosphatase 2C 70 isoform X3 n=1 Tax=Manihot esculenta TaxID=3983 RepID=UPI001CC66D4C|nr:protein phosphatase 2C 70 isoform X3 [Manihot esculenta]
MAMMLLESTVIVLLMLLLILLLIFLACKPWRFFFSSTSYTLKVGDLDRPLVSDEVESNDWARNCDVEGACYQNEGSLCLSRPVGLVHEQRLPSESPHLVQGGSLVLDVSEPTVDVSVGQTIFRKEHLAELQTHVRQEDQSPIVEPGLQNDKNFQEFVPKVIPDQRSCLSLEVISGPCCGLHCSIQSTSTSRLPLTLGRVSSDLLLNDSEVSGKHAMINWNMDKKKWELVDMGSLNGTLLNSRPINHPDSGSRHWSDPIELTNGDILTLGTTSSVHVQITSTAENEMPFGVGMTSDPMSMRRGGKKLAMEDVCYYQWPLPGIEQFGVFGICDGHGGIAAAKSASNVDGKQIKMTEDHRVTSYSERLRISEIGEPLKDGDTRLCGLNLARMLGDKFLKQQDARFSSEPYISEAVHIHQASRTFALLASDGFWDVVSVKKAVQLVVQMKERDSTRGENPAEMVANFLLSEARTLRTKDNTSIIFVDFNRI